MGLLLPGRGPGIVISRKASILEFEKRKVGRLQIDLFKKIPRGDSLFKWIPFSGGGLLMAGVLCFLALRVLWVPG